jgi:hypothetical protein
MAKAAQDVTKGREQYKGKNTQELNDVVTEIPQETLGPNEAHEDNVSDLDKGVNYYEEASKTKITDREQEAIDRRNEKSKQKNELEEKQNYGKNKSVRQGEMSGGEKSYGTDEDSESSASSSSTSENGDASSSTSNSTASASSTSTSDDDTSSSSEASSEPKRKKTS